MTIDKILIDKFLYIIKYINTISDVISEDQEKIETSCQLSPFLAPLTEIMN